MYERSVPKVVQRPKKLICSSVNPEMKRYVVPPARKQAGVRRRPASNDWDSRTRKVRAKLSCEPIQSRASASMSLVREAAQATVPVSRMVTN